MHTHVYILSYVGSYGPEKSLATLQRDKLKSMLQEFKGDVSGIFDFGSIEAEFDEILKQPDAEIGAASIPNQEGPGLMLQVVSLV